MRNDFESNYLAHHGILGMKWGVRRYQNPDGSLTTAGRERYGVKESGHIGDISTAKGYNRRVKDLKKAIKKNEKARGKEHTKIANNPENFLGLNKKHGKKIAEYTENIKKGEEELAKLFAKAKEEGFDVKRDKVLEKKSEVTDGAIIDKRARDAAKKAGLDQGDNWKVYRDAQAGDKKAQKIIKQWESDKLKVEVKKDRESLPETKNVMKNGGLIYDKEPSKGLSEKTKTWLGDADETFDFLAKNTYDNITGYGNRVGDVKNAKNFSEADMKAVFRDAFDDNPGAQKAALKLLYAAECSRYMDEESSDPESSQVFRNSTPKDSSNRLSDLGVGDDWGSSSVDEWKGYIEENVGHKIDSLTGEDKADALKKSGLYYTEEDLEYIRKHG